MPSPDVCVIIPFSGTEQWRLEALSYVTDHYRTTFPEWQLVIGTHPEYREGWMKALAVRDGLSRTDAKTLVIADADCICVGIGEAVDAVLSGAAKWAVPHNSIRRLSQASTIQLYAGAPVTREMERACKVYSAVPGGGITAVDRATYEDVPLDPRFHTTHGEDVAWSVALTGLVGKPARFQYDLYHLWHPPIPSFGMKYESNSRMATQYKRAERRARELRVVIEGAKSWEPSPMPYRYDSGTTCAVIVPVMKRPENAKPFMESFRASTDGAAVYAIADADDVPTIRAWRDNGARVIISDRGCRFGQKANVGYESTCEPWLLFVGDDVKFHAGWLDAALKASDDKYDLVSTNDLGRTDLDTLAVHPMIRRTYVANVGACWDGPGTVAHEGYGHWYVDAEWSLLARDRDTYVYAPDAVIEHMHPFYEKSPDDQVYRLGQAQSRKDKQTYAGRERLYRRKIRG